MAKAPPVYLNGKKYTKTKALAVLKEILNKYYIGDTLNECDFRTVVDVLEYHPERDDKVGCGIKSIQIVKEEVYGHRRFDLVRTDGSRQDFSYIKSLQSDNLHFKDVMNAMRFCVLDQVRGFKNDAYGNKKYVRCAITGLNMQKKDAHTDHKPPLTFDMLVFNFLRERQLRIEDIQVEDTAFVSCLDLADKTIKAEWQQYHEENAQLQVVLDHANLGQSKTKVPWKELDEQTKL